MTPKVIYHSDISNAANNNQKFYFGVAETTFKECCSNHKQDVKPIKYQYNTELTKYIWNLKNNSINYNIQWKVVDKVYGNANSTMCKLFLIEQLWIINHINDNNIWMKSQNLLKMKTFRPVLIKTYKEETVDLSFVSICIFVFLF